MVRIWLRYVHGFLVMVLEEPTVELSKSAEETVCGSLCVMCGPGQFLFNGN